MWHTEVEEERPGRPATLVVPAGYCLQHMWQDVASGRLVLRFAYLGTPPEEGPLEDPQQSSTRLTPPPLDLSDASFPGILGPNFTVFKNDGDPLA